MTFKELYTDLILKNGDRLKSEKPNQIIVVQGQVSLLNTDSINNLLADPKTFDIESDELTFSKDWFANIFTTLQQTKDFHLLSFPQFSYLINYIDPSFFTDRVVILKDNLRQLFPIEKSQYLEKEGKENIELRPEKLPVYQAEQLAINDKYFYSIKTPINSFQSIDIFTDSKELTFSNDQTLESIDVSSDPYSLDSFINNCIEQNTLSKKVVVKFYSKQPLNPSVLETLKKLNSLLNSFGGTLFILEDVSIASDYKVSEQTQKLLESSPYS